MRAMRLFLIRHALPDYPGGKRMCLGQKTDLPLSIEGHEQAQALCKVFSKSPVNAVFSSPMQRAHETAQAIAGDKHTVHTLPELTELDGGEWDGLTFDEIRAQYPDSFSNRPFCPPGGESDEDGIARALLALERIRQEGGGCAVAVSHGAIIRALLCGLTGTPTSEKKRFSLNCAAVSILDYCDGKWIVRAFNLPAEELRRHIHGA